VVFSHDTTTLKYLINLIASIDTYMLDQYVYPS
jgi:hypothetical protein